MVAVSGGVDSMVLLHLLTTNYQLPTTTLLVAHYDHGIREDSALDRKLVQAAAAGYGLQFVYDEGRLGPGASEAAARAARYDFLHKVRQACQATAIVTAHHQDDLLETAIINLIRGTGRRGLSSLRSTDIIKRPLLKVPKAELLAYAEQNNLKWREDPTNQDTRYLRNYVRQLILPKFRPEQRQQLLGIIENITKLNDQIDARLVNHLHQHPAANRLDRKLFVPLSHIEAREVMAAWLRRNGCRFDKKTIERLVVAAKTYRPGQRADVDLEYQMLADSRGLALVKRRP